MAGDILFGRNRIWSAEATLFDEALRRAEAHCGGDAVIGALLCYAREISSLPIQRYRRKEIRVNLLRALQEGAAQWLEALANASSQGDSRTAQSLKRLVE